MRNILAIAGKELKSYFASPVAYVVAAVFLVITGYFFAGDLISNQEAAIRGFLFPASFVLLFISPLLTMRLLAEEQKLGTLELLLTAPLRDAEVVMGKFLAALAILAVMLGLTLYYPLLLFLFGDPDPGPIASGYLGLFLVGAAFLSIGLLASSLSSNQIVAAVLALGVLMLLWFIYGAAGFMGGEGPAGEVANYLSSSVHFPDFYWGVIDTKDIIYYLSLVAIALFATIGSLESRRWR